MSDEKEYQDYLDQQEYQHYQQAAQQAQNPQQIPDAADKAAQGGKPDAQPTTLKEQAFRLADQGMKKALPSDVYNYLKPMAMGMESGAQGVAQGTTLGNYSPDKLGQQAIDEHPYMNMAGKMAGGLTTGAVLGNGIGALAPQGAGIAASLGRVGSNIAGAGLQGYLSKPADGGSRLEGAEDAMKSPWAWGPAIAGEAANVGSALSQKWANNSMKRAVGLTGAAGKNAPADIGNRIVGEGIWGTKSGMANQVSSKYEQAENEIQTLADDMAHSGVTGNELSESVRAKGSRFIDPATGQPFSEGEAGNAAFQRVANNLETKAPGYSPGSPSTTNTKYAVMDGEKVPLSSETLPGSEATQGTYNMPGLLRLKRLGDENAFNNSGLMGNTYDAEAARAQADSARSAMAGLSDGAMPAALKREQTLIYANKGLSKPDMVSKNPVNLTDIGSAMVGAASHGLPGAGASVLASKAAVSPLVQSLWAHLLQRGAAPGLDLVSNPEVAQGLFGAENSRK